MYVPHGLAFMHSRPEPERLSWSPDYQLWISRGVLCTYGFQREEAILCFQKALTFDSDCAMAHYFMLCCWSTTMLSHQKRYTVKTLSSTRTTCGHCWVCTKLRRVKGRRQSWSQCTPFTRRQVKVKMGATSLLMCDSMGIHMHMLL